MSTNFADIEMWMEAVDRKFFDAGRPFGREEFDQLHHNFGAVSSDTPAIAFAEEVVQAYPEAKVILVERDIESWYESWMCSVIKNIVSSQLGPPQTTVANTETVGDLCQSAVCV